MNDSQTTIQELRDLVGQFVKDRDWNQFHDPKNLSMDIAAEAAELLEKFLWCSNSDSFNELQKERQEVEDELADVFLGTLKFANATGIDITKAVRHKLALSAQKYPIDKAKGRTTKYNKL